MTNKTINNMIKRFFSFSLMLLLAIGAWADEYTVGETKTWVFGELSGTDEKSSVTAINSEYYVRASAALNRTFTLTNCNNIELTFADGTTTNTGTYYWRAKGSLSGTAPSKTLTAGSETVAGMPSFAFNTTVAGTVYVKIRQEGSGDAATFKIYFADGDNLNYVQYSGASRSTNTIIDEIAYTAPKGGSFFITSAANGAWGVYGVRFVPSTVSRPTVSSTKTWTFNNLSLLGTHTTVYSDGLYMRASSSRNVSVASLESTISDLKYGDGTNVGDVTKSVRLNYGCNGTWEGALTASSTNGKGMATLAFSTSVPGTAYAITSGDTNMKMFFGTGESGSNPGNNSTAATVNNGYGYITASAIAGGHYFLGYDTNVSLSENNQIYAIKFVPEAITAPTIKAGGTITEGTSNMGDNTKVTIKTYYTYAQDSEPTDPTTSSTEYDPSKGITGISGTYNVKAITYNTQTGVYSDVKYTQNVLVGVSVTANVVDANGTAQSSWGSVKKYVDNSHDPADVATTYERNTSITLVAIPNAGYQFVGWKTADGTANYGDAPQSLLLNLGSVTEDVTVSAVFKAVPAVSKIASNTLLKFDSYTVNGTKLAGSSVYCDESMKIYLSGHEQTYKNFAEINVGSYSYNSDEITFSSRLSFAGGANRSLTDARYSNFFAGTRDAHTKDAVAFKVPSTGKVIAYVSGPSDRVFKLYVNNSIGDTTKIASNDIVKMEATVAANDNVLLGTTGGNGYVYGIKFVPTYTLTSSGVNGTITMKKTNTDGEVIASGSKLEQGTTVYVSATPNDGYYLSSLKYGDTDLVNNSTFEMPGAATTVTAIFTAKTAPTVANLAAATPTYNGSAQNLVTTPTVTGGTISYSTEKNGTYSETIPQGANAGDYTVWYKVTGDATHADIAATQVENVSIAQKAISITASDQSIAYNSAIATTTDKVAVTPGLVEGHSITDITLAKTNNENVNVGEYSGGITPSAATIKSGETDVTANYNITYVTGKLTITAIAASVTAAPTAVTGDLTYTGSAQTLFNTGTASGGTMMYKVTTTNTKPENTAGFTNAITQETDAATYFLWYYVEGDANHISTAINDAGIQKAIGNGSMTPTVTPYNAAYDGAAHGITVTCDGATIKYSETEGTYTLDASPTITNVSESPKTVYYKVSKENYADVTGSATITITAKDLPITADPKSKYVGENDPELTYQSDGLVGSDAITGALARVAGEEVGTYNITQGTLAAGGNYNIVFTGATLTINALPTYDIMGVTADANGNKVEANVASATAGTEITLTITTADNYTLKSISATSVTLSGTGTTRTFTMPSAAVTVKAVWEEKTQESAKTEVTENVDVVDNSNATVTSVEVGAETTSITISGTVSDGTNDVPITSIADGTFTSENTANVQSIDLSDTQVTFDVSNGTGRDKIDALKNIPENTLVYLPATANNVTGDNVIIKSGENYTCTDFVMDGSNSTGKSYSVPKAFTATNVSLNREFDENVAATVCLPYALTQEQANALGAFYYFSSVTGTTVNMTQATSGLEANKPYMFLPNSTVGGSNSVTATNVAVSISGTQSTGKTSGDVDFTFQGVIADKTFTSDEIAGGIYGFAADTDHGASSVGQFVKCSMGAYIKAFRAYLVCGSNLTGHNRAQSASELPETLTVKLINSNGSTTSIGELQLMDTNEDAARYNIKGQRVDKSYKGLVIKNGKKVYNK